MKSVKKYINKFLSGIIFFCMFFAEVYAGNVSRINLSMNTDWAFFRGDIENGESITADDSCCGCRFQFRILCNWRGNIVVEM